MKTPILLIGGGGHCKSVIDVIEQENNYFIAGIIDKRELIGQKVFDYKIIGCDDNLENLFTRFSHAVVTVGHVHSPDLRIKLFGYLKQIGFTLPSIISPRAYVSKYAFVGEGSVVLHDALVNAGARIGENCIINSKALIEHDCVIGNLCLISTGAILNGATCIAEGSFVGSNAVSKEGVFIAERSFIKAGSVIK